MWSKFHPLPNPSPREASAFEDDNLGPILHLPLLNAVPEDTTARRLENYALLEGE